MDFFTEWLNEVVDRGIWVRPAVAVGIFTMALIIRGLFTRFLFKLILSLSRKTKTDFDTNILLAFERPLKSLIVAGGLYFSLTYLSFNPQANTLILTIFRSYIIASLAWGLYNLLGSDSYKEIASKFNLDLILVDFISKVLRFVLLALTGSVIAQEFDYDVNGFLAGLGLGGLAFALAAKDAVSNVFGGVVIILDKPFSVGDWIDTPSVEGTVEEMSFRSTKVRTFANALVTVPNSVIANQPVTNWTRMGKRRITFHLGVTYTTPREKLKKCVEETKAMLEKHPGIHKDTIFVRFDKFSENSLDIFLYFFTSTTIWAEYLQVKEDVNFKILEILEQQGVSVAFPSRSIYFENSLDSRVCNRSDREKPGLV